jgi:uncharacterized protein with NAD-binding domain and iron-sulfur cluster
MKKTVIILGGGVAGMSAAHELIDRGFEVEVYEKQQEYVGGKARSVNVPGTNIQYPDKYLPGEHGFRFFPGFYKHVINTMQRIPLKTKDGKPSKKTVYDNLVVTETIKIARDMNTIPIVFPVDFLGSWSNLKMVYNLYKNRQEMFELKPGEMAFFFKKMFQIASSSQARRNWEYEGICWWDFMDADNKSVNYQELLVVGVTRTLVAADAHIASTKTDGDIIWQLLFNFMDPTIRTDRLFTAPTNDAWLTPWYDYLTGKGVKYHKSSLIDKFNMNDKGEIDSVDITQYNDQGESSIINKKADYYILAIPADKAAENISDDMINADPDLGNIKNLVPDMSWMTGMQFYLNQVVKINPGHVNYAYTKWALTSIDQISFWKDYDLSIRGNGKVKSILSVDISDWTDKDFAGQTGDKCTKEEIKYNVWAQLKRHLNRDGFPPVLEDGMVEYFYLDDDIVCHPDDDFNRERMIVNAKYSWQNRPEAVTKIPNLFLASDYVRTYTDLATMEAANEAARRAVNGILIASGSNATQCQIWNLTEPWALSPLKWWDGIRFGRGKDYSSFPIWLILFMIPWGLAYVIWFVAKILFYKIFHIKPR